MLRTRIVGTVGALALLAAPAVAVAHGDGHHGGKHAKQHHKKKPRDVTGTAVASVQSFANGELTLALPSGKTLTANVTDRTVVICRSAMTVPASTTTPPSTVPVTGKRGRGRCGTDKLVTGAKVSDARLSLKGDTVIWKKVVVVS